MTTASAAEGTNGSSLNCSMNGYQELVSEVISLSLLAITLNVSIIEAILSGMPDLAKAFDLSYKFLKGTGGWIGYVIAAVYYFGLDLGYADVLCTYSQYGYVVIYYLNVAITFGQNAN